MCSFTEDSRSGTGFIMNGLSVHFTQSAGITLKVTDFFIREFNSRDLSIPHGLETFYTNIPESLVPNYQGFFH
jgi:hypothetical protein